MSELDNLGRAIWMTWYTQRWPYNWVELGHPGHGGIMRHNWKTFVILSAS